jgi:hypothetical protein
VRYLFLVLSVLFLCNPAITAQDDHYWSQQYGAESTLMGGAMVGGAEDNSAIYYNPGALSFIVNPSLSVDANVYRMDKILIRDGAGKGTNLNSAQISIYPEIISGMLNLFKESKLKFSYTILTRNHSNVLMNTRYSVKNTGDIPIAGSTSFVGAYDYVNQLEELWFGLGAGYKINEKLGIGATVFTSYRGQSYQLNDNIRAISYADSEYIFNTIVQNESVKYSTVRLLAKAGVSYVTGRMKYGITITTPSFGIYGKGETMRDNSHIVISENPENTADNFLITDKKTGVKTTYKHPLSIAAGFDYRTSKARLAVSAEYFFRINTYHLMKPVSDPFIYPPSYLDSAFIEPVISSFLQIDNAAKPVCNFSVGFSHSVYKNFSLLLGFSTDFSSYSPTPETKDLLHGFGNWDIYHFSSGISWGKAKHNVSLGLSYALTPSKNIPAYATINQISASSGDAEILGHSLAFVLGYTYFFSRSD